MSSTPARLQENRTGYEPQRGERQVWIEGIRSKHFSGKLTLSYIYTYTHTHSILEKGRHPNVLWETALASNKGRF